MLDILGQKIKVDDVGVATISAITRGKLLKVKVTRITPTKVVVLLLDDEFRVEYSDCYRIDFNKFCVVKKVV